MEVKQVMLVDLVEDQLFITHRVINVVQVTLVDLIHLKEIRVAQAHNPQPQPTEAVVAVEQELLEEVQQLQLAVQVEQDQVHLLYQAVH
tara:strand:+ start:380 stop:646 length:267 start_codon:yes stop_codon:yes gene_type:complete